MWSNIYQHFDPIAIKLGFFTIHWYGLMYVFALLSVLFVAKWIVKKDNLPIEQSQIDDYFVWAEIGVIVGARVGYILFYDTHLSYYLLNPWQIFNPFMDGTFVGIRGFSYHGGVIGFLIGTILFAKKSKIKFWLLVDISALSAGFGYFFGRIGNFLNQELIGRGSDLPWAIFVDGKLRHPSTLYEAFLEGLMIFLILFLYRKRKTFDGELAMIYGMLYAIFRSFCELYRQPDIQLGFIYSNWLTMGQLLSFGIFISSIIGYYILKGKR